MVSDVVCVERNDVEKESVSCTLFIRVLSALTYYDNGSFRCLLYVAFCYKGN